MPAANSLIPRRGLAPDAARELEAVVRRLWMTEPNCALRDRRRVVQRLQALSVTVERLVLQHETVDKSILVDDQRRQELADCVERLDRLPAHWPADVAWRLSNAEQAGESTLGITETSRGGVSRASGLRGWSQ